MLSIKTLTKFKYHTFVLQGLLILLNAQPVRILIFLNVGASSKRYGLHINLNLNWKIDVQTQLRTGMLMFVIQNYRRSSRQIVENSMRVYYGDDLVKKMVQYSMRVLSWVLIEWLYELWNMFERGASYSLLIYDISYDPAMLIPLKFSQLRP